MTSGAARSILVTNERHSPWLPEPGDWQIHEGEVHVWRIDVARHLPRLDEFQPFLTDEDRARAGRFQQHVDRANCLLGRAHLRRLLGRVLNVKPADVPIRTDEFGKPHGPGGAPQFNLSHTAGLVLIALCRNARVGIDVERIRPLDDLEALARSVLSPSEQGDLEARDADERLRIFYRYWTRKEACAKGQGLGASLEFASLELPLMDGSSQWCGTDMTTWLVRDLEVDPETVAAVAVELGTASLFPWDAQ